EKRPETRPRLELAILRALEGRRMRRLGGDVRVERRGAIRRGVMHRNPAGLEAVAIGVERHLVGVVEGGLAFERDGVTGPVEHLQRFRLPVLEISGTGRHKTVDEAVWPLGGGSVLERAADVFDYPDVAGRVVLNALIAAASQRPGDVGHRRGKAR